VDKKIMIIRGNSFELLRVLENNTAIQRMSWHPFSNLLAVGAIGDGSKLIDVEKDSIIHLSGANANGTTYVKSPY
jgi:hypothetical protein